MEDFSCFCLLCTFVMLCSKILHSFALRSIMSYSGEAHDI